VIHGEVHDRVEMAVTQDIVGMEVIGDEAALGQGPRVDEGQQGGEVLRLGPLADHDVHPQAELFPGLAKDSAFVIGTEPCRNIGAQVPAGEQWGMAVPGPVVKGRDLFQDGGVGEDNAGVVHHLRQPQNPRMVLEGEQVGRGERGPRCLQVGRGDAGWEHEVKIDGQPLGGVEDKTDAPCAQDVGQLVGIGDDGRCSVGQDRPGQR